MIPDNNRHHLLGLMQGAELPDDRGWLQSKLVEFLVKCPYGIVMLEGVQDMPLSLVPVWMNALSEQVEFCLMLCHYYAAIMSISKQICGQ